MKIQVLTRGENSHSYKWEKAFLDGLKSHGVTAYMSNSAGLISLHTDLIVLWGVRNKRKILDAKAMGINYLVLERGYIGDREEYTSCGFNGLNGHANFVNKGLGDLRSKQFQYLMQPFQEKRGNYILIMGQMENDASVRDIGWKCWLENTYNELKTITDRPIYFRPHPLAGEQSIPEGLEIIQGDLHYVVKKAHCVVTLNSNSAVDTILAGVPCTTVNKGSMAYDITSHDLRAVINPIFKDRQQWLNELAFCQWNIEEIQGGSAWAHLKAFYG